MNHGFRHAKQRERDLNLDPPKRITDFETLLAPLNRAACTRCAPVCAPVGIFTNVSSQRLMTAHRIGGAKVGWKVNVLVASADWAVELLVADGFVEHFIDGQAWGRGAPHPLGA